MFLWPGLMQGHRQVSMFWVLLAIAIACFSFLANTSNVKLSLLLLVTLNTSGWFSTPKHPPVHGHVIVQWFFGSPLQCGFLAQRFYGSQVPNSLVQWF